MKRLKQMAPYLIAIIIAFYLFPILPKDTGSFMLLLLGITPMVCFITALIYGMNKGVEFIYPLFTGILFTPTIFIYYNESAWVYIVMFAITSLVGNVLGALLFKKQRTGS